MCGYYIAREMEEKAKRMDLKEPKRSVEDWINCANTPAPKVEDTTVKIIRKYKYAIRGCRTGYCAHFSNGAICVFDEHEMGFGKTIEDAENNMKREIREELSWLCFYIWIDVEETINNMLTKLREESDHRYNVFMSIIHKYFI